VPDVTGEKEAAAVTALGNAGILASLVFVPGSDPLGTVLQQAKPAGTKVPFHAHVQINVSRGPNATTDATVPDVIGQTLQQAVSTLNGAHLRLIYLKYPVTSRAQAGKVVQQSPLRGATTPENAQVVVYLGAFQQG
jgi:serine/threonine-protein kinase